MNYSVSNGKQKLHASFRPLDIYHFTLENNARPEGSD